MTVFAILTCLLVIAVLLVLLRPFLRKTSISVSAESAAPALAVLREQRAELRQAHAAGQIDDAALAQGLSELEQRALDESSVASTPASDAGENSGRRAWAISLAISIPAICLGLYLILGSPDALDPQRRAAPMEASVTPEQIDAMVAKLAAKVAANPDDVEGAMMLGRSYMALDRHAEAARVFAALSARQPDNAQVLADWADALASAEGQKLDGEPARLIARALQIDPQNVKALALAGTLAFERADFASAIAQWQKIIDTLPADNALSQSLQAMIGEAQKRSAQPAAQMPAGNALTLTGEVRLAAALRARAKPEDSLFVYLRPAAGGPPLAGMRFTVADLPLQIDFAKAQRMTGIGALLPEKVIVGARISPSGQVMPRPGDLQGTSAAVSPQGTGLIVEINTVVE